MENNRAFNKLMMYRNVQYHDLRQKKIMAKTTNNVNETLADWLTGYCVCAF